MDLSCAENMPGDIQDAIDEARSELNDAEVDYEETVSTKLEIARCIFGRQGKADLEVEPPMNSCTPCGREPGISQSSDEHYGVIAPSRTWVP